MTPAIERRRPAGFANCLTEDQLVEALRTLLVSPKQARVLIGIGDDAAVWQPSRSHRSVMTTDAAVEGVHFSGDTMSLQDAGWRAMAANLSDIAAMGARPRLSVVALGIPPRAEQGDVLAFYRGLHAAADWANCAIAGGDLTRASSWFAVPAVIGEVRPSHVKTRSGARSGDILAVTGTLGASRAGLDALTRRIALSGELRSEAVRAHRTPKPRLAEGRWLSASSHVHAMMDISDGLSSDLQRLCANSRCAVRVDEVPAARSAVAVAQIIGKDPWEYALDGGEDFELLAAIQPRAFRHLAGRFAKRFGRPLYAIGSVQRGAGVTMRRDEGEVPLPPHGWDHLR